ncbi:TPA: His-Xaa-Ser system radical SAM maturase HxsC [Providencia stuartii]|uniref:His-Xaa-Ser system radical SAM maturase HxsC n=1 Tax=Providencia sp. PROV267 TaxID=2949955 RepID=UPI00234A1E8E|nr:His-Xaa-Ser system radical SAM maturase HxsC [Providencia sp. PROV267]
MPNVVRNDQFILLEPIPAGYYQLYKDQLSSPEFYFDNILVVKEKNVEYHTAGVKHVIADETLYHSIESGDIASVTMNKMRIILSRKANHNTLLLTERCNNLCLFCSQPPKNISDSWLLDVATQALAAFKLEGVIGISGGEPLLYGIEFIEFLEHVKNNTPKTALHILTNGRAFKDLMFTKQVANIAKELPITFGIPLYSASASIHNKLVSSDGAFEETISGIINAGNSGLNIELRFIPTNYNYSDLYTVVEMAGRVFSNINQISVMNLEATGWARKNWKSLYVNPETYLESLQKAIDIAERSQLPIVLFNYPLCHISQDLWQYSVQSISDWKNYYPDDCLHCKMMGECGGYFSSSYGQYHQPPRVIV